MDEIVRQQLKDLVKVDSIEIAQELVKKDDKSIYTTVNGDIISAFGIFRNNNKDVGDLNNLELQANNIIDALNILNDRIINGKNEPLKFTNLGNRKGYIDIYGQYLKHDVTLSCYNLDGSGKWETFAFGPTGDTINVRIHCNANDYILIKGDNEYISSSTSDYLFITGDSTYPSDFAVSGSIMSLLGDYVRDVPCNYGFYCLFGTCTSNHYSTLDVSELKLCERNIMPYCYRALFQNQQNLTEPIFPPQEIWPKSLCSYYIYGTGVEEYEIEFTADDLGQLHYFSANCTNLTKAKITVHGKTTQRIFWRMFQNCTSLAEVTLDCEDFDGIECCLEMFYGVTTTGVLYVRPELVDNEVINAAIPETWTIEAIP